MRYICAQPATTYYTWQVEVMINNFLSVGINLNHVDVVCMIDNDVPEKWSKLANAYPARFFFYRDTRETRNYISSVRPNILKQHFKAHSYLSEEVIFYHDCDMIFSNPIEWSKFEGDGVWYGSDTNSYINYDYIISKGEDVFNKMTDIVGIDPNLVIENNDHSIGAQYILKNVDTDFWNDVERDSERLYKEISSLSIEKKKKDPKYHELQIWCADMWAVLWNGWKRGYKTQCHDDLKFSWATSSEKDYYTHNIFHNAGVTSSSEDLFFKAMYIDRLPYNLNLNLKDGRASKKYYEWIQRVEKISVL